MAKPRLKLRGDFRGQVYEDIDILDVGVLKVIDAPRKPKAIDKFLTTNHGSDLPLGDLIAML